MKQDLIIGNWKMKLSPQQSLKLALDLKKGLVKPWQSQAIICPDFLSLAEVAKVLQKTKIKLGAQDCFWQDQGAFTGEVSPSSLKQLGVNMVILGHSERRQNCHEDSQMINAKIKAILKHNLVPIICLGENKQQKQQGQTKTFLRAELKRLFKGVKLDSKQKMVLAYEPVWAISSNKNTHHLSADKTAEIMQLFKQEISKQFSHKLAENNFYFIYGGSVSYNNVQEFAVHPDIQGLLVGSDSLQARHFVKICQAMLE